MGESLLSWGSTTKKSGQYPWYVFLKSQFWVFLPLIILKQWFFFRLQTKFRLKELTAISSDRHK